MIKIAIFTGTRAEYGLMRTLIKKFNYEKDFIYYLLVSSTHLNTSYGNTIEEINSDCLKIYRELPISIKSSFKKDMATQTAETINLVSQTLEDLKPNYLLVLGDRFESFGAAISAHILGIKIIHLHGGETSLGALDDKLRHAISQLSSIHFTSSEIHMKKVSDILGSSEGVFNVGPMVIDGLLNLKNISKEQFQNKTGFIFSQINLLITFHPETLSADFGISGFVNLLKSLENYNCNILFTAPNADTGSKYILDKIIKFISKNEKRYFYIPSLGQDLYLNALLLFDCIVGNSSSGIIEAPLLNKKVLNIGNRQKGRYRFGSVIDVSNDYKSISKALENILKIDKFEKFEFEEFKKNNINKSPSNKIIKILRNYNSK